MTTTRSKRQAHLTEDSQELEMTSMIDVTFLLLIFFLCTLRFKTLEGKLAAYLPKGHGVTDAPADAIEALRIRVDVAEPGTRLTRAGQPWSGGGRYHFSPDRVLRYQVGAFETTSLADAQARMIEQHALSPDREVSLDPRAGTVYGDVVPVLDALVLAGFDTVTFVGTYER